MKKLILYPIFFALLFAACDQESPMDTELYPKKVYIVGASDEVIDRDLHIGNNPDTINTSVAVSGSLPTDRDVVVTISEDSSAIANYNRQNLSSDDIQYQWLDESLYSFPPDLTIKAGSVYNTFPIYIEEPGSLHCDSLYMIPLRLNSTSEYELTEEDTVALVRINMVNDYSGLYYVDGRLTNTTNPDDFTEYEMSRNLEATDDGNTVRMYHYNNENKDYRSDYAFKITVDENDSTLTYASWDQFQIYDGGGVYHPSRKLYEFWYEYDKNGEVWRAEGFLYEERESDEARRKLNNWIEEQRAE
ncbi:MAG: BT_3987 domain-containing protein [Bacteroidales bacterium]